MSPTSPQSGQGNSGQDKKDLLQLLLDQKLISLAQAQLAQADQEVTGLTLEDIVLARGWISEEVLEQLLPKDNSPPAATDVVAFQPGSRTYDQNLKDYRRLMEKILGTAWD